MEVPFINGGSKGNSKPWLYHAEPLVYLTATKLINGNLSIRHEPMNNNRWYKLGIHHGYNDLYIHKNNMDSIAPEGKTYFSVRLQRWVDFSE
jgi:hypothetical protein